MRREYGISLGLSLLVHGLLVSAAAGYSYWSSAPLFGVARGSGSHARNLEVSIVSSSRPMRRAAMSADAVAVAVAPQEQAVHEMVSEAGEVRDASGDGSSGVAGDGAWTEALPNYLSNPPPKYPELSRRRGEEGVVMLFAEVTPEGRVKALSVSKSSGFPLLDEAAMRAVRSWEFQPANRGGVRVESRITFPVRFRIND